MEKDVKVVAFYLPQFHEIPENNEWWGKGFTEWTNVKKATPLYEGHEQPRVPLDGNYYDLSCEDTLKWQVDLANKYNIYGFCIYQYWFSGKRLLEKPLEMLLKNKDLNIHFCISWANESWTNAWEGSNQRVLIEQRYGDREEWIEHFNYLLPFFKDERYIYQDGKPLFVIYRPDLINCLDEMIDCWNELAEKNGLEGICFAYQHHKNYFYSKHNMKLQYGIEYQPGFAQLAGDKGINRLKRKINVKLGEISERCFKGYFGVKRKQVAQKSYDSIWDTIINDKHDIKNMYPGIFVNWDNTPRHGVNGLVISDATPQKFYQYFLKYLKKVKNEYSTELLFVFAWNEWAEGGYLEPDELNGYGYLEAIKRALEEA